MKNKKLFMSITRISTTVICVVVLVYFLADFLVKRHLRDKFEKLKASTDQVVLVYMDYPVLEKQGIKFPLSNSQIKLIYTYDDTFLNTDKEDKLPIDVVNHCIPEGKAYEITGNTTKEFLSFLKLNKSLGDCCSCGGNPKILFLSKGKLLAYVRLLHGQNIRSKLFPGGDVSLIKSSQKKLKSFFIKHKLPVFD